MKQQLLLLRKEPELASFFATTIILYGLFQVFGGSIPFRIIFASVAGPFVGYAGFYSFSFFLWVSGLISEDRGHQLMTLDSLTHPAALATVGFFFWGFLNPKLYGHR